MLLAGRVGTDGEGGLEGRTGKAPGFEGGKGGDGMGGLVVWRWIGYRGLEGGGLEGWKRDIGA